MNTLKLLAAFALVVGIAGCDTNAFTEDIPDPATEGLPPYVAFDIAQLDTGNWLYDSAQDALGSVRAVSTPGTNPMNLGNLRVRLPMAIGEDVAVAYTLSGDAVYGVDYQIQVFDLGDMDWVTLPSGNGTVDILYFDENPQPVQVAPYYRDIRIQVLPGSPSAGTERSVRLDLVSASAPSGREITIGRFPTNRDNRITVIIDG